MIETYHNPLVMVIRKGDIIIEVISEYTSRRGGRYLRKIDQISGEPVNLSHLQGDEGNKYFPEIREEIVSILGGDIVSPGEDLKMYATARGHLQQAANERERGSTLMISIYDTADLASFMLKQLLNSDSLL